MLERHRCENSDAWWPLVASPIYYEYEPSVESMQKYWTNTGQGTTEYCASFKYNPITCLDTARHALLNWPDWREHLVNEDSGLIDTRRVTDDNVDEDLRNRALQLETSIAKRRHAVVANVTFFGVPGVPCDLRKIGMATVIGLLEPPFNIQPAHVKEVLEYVFGRARALPIRRSWCRPQSTTWRTNMQWACEWEKDAMKLLLREEWRHRKYMRDHAEALWMPGEPDLPHEAEGDWWQKSPPRNIICWYGQCS